MVDRKQILITGNNKILCPSIVHEVSDSNDVFVLLVRRGRSHVRKNLQGFHIHDHIEIVGVHVAGQIVVAQVSVAR